MLALRNWEIINSISANYFIEPDYAYTFKPANVKSVRVAYPTIGVNAANVQQAATFRNVFNYGAIVSDGVNGTFEHIYAFEAYLIDTTATVPTDIRSQLDFARGIVADSLGEAFGQTIGIDRYPVLYGAAIYKHTINEQTIYLNTTEVVNNAVATMAPTAFTPTTR